METRGDELGLSVELELYHETLIPDARGDVLTLLEALDGIINSFKGILFYFATETPEIPDELRQDFNDLAKLSCATVEALVLAARAFFRDSSGCFASWPSLGASALGTSSTTRRSSFSCCSS